MANVLRMKRRWAGGAGAPASLKSGEPAYNGVDDVLYIGYGDDGAGNATSIKAIAGFGAAVMLTGNQLIDGIKTFNTSPVVPTLATADATTKAANAAFVQAAITAAVTAASIPDGDKGDITVSGSGSSWNVDADAITNVKLANMPANTIKGNYTGSPADPTDGTVSTVRTALSINNVDNTSDANKPVSTAQATAIGLKISSTEKGAASGVAPLDSGSKIAALYLPAYVDDVLEFANLAAFPATGTTGIIYVALDTNKTYRWSGSAYIEISPSPGSTDSVPEGSVNLYYTTARARGDVIVQTVTNGDTTHSPSGDAVFDLLAAGYQPLDATLSAIAALVTAANQSIYSTGVDAFSMYSLTAGGRALGGVAGTIDTFPYFSAANVVTLGSITAAGRALIDDADITAQRATLGLGTMATQNANAVAITGGTIDGITLDGGTF